MAKNHYIYDLEGYYAPGEWKSIVTCTTKASAIKHMKKLSDLHKANDYRVVAYLGYNGIYLAKYIIDLNLNRIEI